MGIEPIGSTGSTRDPDDVPSDGDGASTHPGGEPSGNPLDPVVRPGVDLSQMPHTGTHPPESGEVPPHVAVVEQGEQDQPDQQDQVAASTGQAPADAPTGADAGTSGSPDADPDPDSTAGLEPGGGVEPGDTPPSAGGTATSLSKNETEKGGRSRLIVPISILTVLALLFVAFFLGQLLELF